MSVAAPKRTAPPARAHSEHTEHREPISLEGTEGRRGESDTEIPFEPTQDVEPSLPHNHQPVPPEWLLTHEAAGAKLSATGTSDVFETEYLGSDGTRVPALVAAADIEPSLDEVIAFVLDLAERKRVEAEAREGERRYREVQMQLAHANRVATVGQLTASIVHEVKQPITAIAINAWTAKRWLSTQPPNLEEVRDALERIIIDIGRAELVVERIRDMVKRVPGRKDRLEVNGLILEVVALTRGEAINNGVSVETRLAEDVPPVQGDRVQLQQVILNLVINAIEAMSGGGARKLLISSKSVSAGVLVAVRDSGPGLAPESLDRVFDAFYTTKPGGFGLGLSICRSIIEAHGGRLWATANVPQGAVFQFTLPSPPESGA